MFEVGDVVTWTSQSLGRTTKKKGEVIMVVPSGNSMDVALTDHIRKQYNCTRIGSLYSRRDHESYLIAVKTGKSDRAKKTLYWPIVKNLKSVK